MHPSCGMYRQAVVCVCVCVCVCTRACGCVRARVCDRVCGTYACAAICSLPGTQACCAAAWLGKLEMIHLSKRGQRLYVLACVLLYRMYAQLLPALVLSMIVLV